MVTSGEQRKIDRAGWRYTKDQKLKVIDLYHEVGRSADKAAEISGVGRETILQWLKTDWAKFRLAELAIKNDRELLAAGLTTLADAKVGHLQKEFVFYGDLERLLNLCIARYEELIPLSAKLQDVNESFKVISDVYLKAINNSLNPNEKSDTGDKMSNFVINLIDKQLVTRPESVQELLNRK